MKKGGIVNPSLLVETLLQQGLPSQTVFLGLAFGGFKHLLRRYLEH
jgi:hypothetical protein